MIYSMFNFLVGYAAGIFVMFCICRPLKMFDLGYHEGWNNATNIKEEEWSEKH